MRLFRVRLPASWRLFASALRISAALVGLLAALLFMGAIPLAGVADPNGAVRLMLALDTSGSMKANDPERLLPHAAALMMHLLDEQDTLGLLRFDSAPVLVMEPGPLTQARRVWVCGNWRVWPPGGSIPTYRDLVECLPIFRVCHCEEGARQCGKKDDDEPGEEELFLPIHDAFTSAPENKKAGELFLG